MTNFWSAWVVVLTSICLVLTAWLLFANRRIKGEVNQAKSHEYDGIVEYDNPLPAWWFYLFVGTLLFALAYLAYFPGMGRFTGLGSWTSVQQWEQEQEEAKALYGPTFAKYAAMPLEEVAKDPKAQQMGQRLFAVNCALCHGSDARGGPGFPNLTDDDWLYGGAPETIKESITWGRNGMMPPWLPVVGEENVGHLVQHLLRLGGRPADAASADKGAAVFANYCVACHGPDAKGNRIMGAPDLTDNVWLYGGSPERISESIAKGRTGQMPKHEELLSADKIHLLAAYVHSLSATP